MLVILDGLRAHRSKLVREYLWAWLKQHTLANYCLANLGELHISARNKLKSM